MNMRAFLLSSFIVIVAMACSRQDQATERGDPAFIGTQDTADSRTLGLTSAASQLIDAFARSDSAAIARLVAFHAKVIDLRALTARGVRAEPVELGYFEIMAGKLATRLNPEYHTYVPFLGASTATVYVIGANDSLRTAWRLSDNRWEVVIIVVMSTADALVNLERDRAYAL